MNDLGAVKGNALNLKGSNKERKDGEPMKLAENEERALKKLHDNLYERYPILDLRLYGSKARGEGRQDSDLDVMIEIPDYDRTIMEEIDDLIYRINLEYDVFISAIIFGKDEIEEGPMSEAPIYKVIQREGIPL
jgi:predicted nucleotidyltransferase